MRSYNVKGIQLSAFFECAKERWWNELTSAPVNNHSTHFACVGCNLICGWTGLLSAMHPTGRKVYVMKSHDAWWLLKIHMRRHQEFFTYLCEPEQIIRWWMRIQVFHMQCEIRHDANYTTDDGGDWNLSVGHLQATNHSQLSSRKIAR